ncbi:hypothetical protein ACFZB9_20315 [Kitasatospora sp. NPDC008050]
MTAVDPVPDDRPRLTPRLCNRWNVAGHFEDVPPREPARRAAAAMGGS